MFAHGKGHYTVWLAPEPEKSLLDLHAAVWTAVSASVDFEPAIERFKPHLSVGHVRGMANAIELVGELQARWTPIHFPVSAIHLIWRNSPPDDAFRIARSVPFHER